MDDNQLFFNFDVEEFEVVEDTFESPLTENLVKIAVMKWLEETDSPNSLALNVPTRLKKYYSDIAASWSMARRNSATGGVYKLLHPAKTMIIECRTSTDECWPETTRSLDLFEKTADLKKELNALKEQIKVDEPHLKTDGNLFDEYAEWNFDKTHNEKYHKLVKEIDEVSYAVYHGTYFERLHRARLADFMYLAVPNGMLKPSEIAEGWGLLYVNNDLSVEVIVEPVADECSAEGRHHLIQNIAATAKQAVLFSQGILKKSDEVVLLKKPKRRRKTLEI